MHALSAAISQSKRASTIETFFRIGEVVALAAMIFMTANAIIVRLSLWRILARVGSVCFAFLHIVLDQGIGIFQPELHELSKSNIALAAGLLAVISLAGSKERFFFSKTNHRT